MLRFMFKRTVVDGQTLATWNSHGSVDVEVPKIEAILKRGGRDLSSGGCDVTDLVGVEVIDSDPLISARHILDARLEQLQFPGARHEVQDILNSLFQRVNHPEEHIPEAVADARHDILLLAGLLP